MWWFWVAGLALLACLGVGAYFVARSPSFWIALVKQIVASAIPDIREYLATRNTPEDEGKMAKCVRMGGEWDNFNKKCRFK
jgi:hypothetical protein